VSLKTIPVFHVAGVGPARGRDLARLGIYTVDDLLNYFPFRYEDRRTQTLTEATENGKDPFVTLRVTVTGKPGVRFRGRRSTLRVPVITEEKIPLTAVWFNQAYLREQFHPGRVVILTGKLDRMRRTLTVAHHDFSVAESMHSGRWVPIYQVSGELTPKVMRSLITTALRQYGGQVEEILPRELVSKYRLISRRDALAKIHAPKDGESVKQAKRRLIFEEFFLFQLKLQAFRHLHASGQPGISHSFTAQDIERFLQSLPFRLTDAQMSAAREILQDMRSAKPMNRLVQGDVGSGKTVVALLAMYAAFVSGYQSALLAPTEILAEQHARAAEKWLAPLGVRVEWLVGSLKDKERAERLERIRSGEAHVVVGTHAILEEEVRFRKLSLVITDEQHRFGVRQRAIFRQKGHHPDVLFMSATPIPRTLAMTLFGDLDVSVIDQLPAGRKPIETYWVPPAKEDHAIRFIRQELVKGRQAYIVAPLIEESDKIEGVENAAAVYERLKERLAGFEVGLLHGRLKGAEKDEIMRRFAANEIQVLVSTTVIEVGVDVPNATVILIYNADRFGLAQLHQLRGRVGRGEHASYCILLAEPSTETGIERLKAMVSIRDGFVLAEKDLELRGPGEFFGLRQSGVPEFKLGDLVEHAHIMKVAREEAFHLVNQPEFWTHPSFAPLVNYLKEERVLHAPLAD
jgi:ATP-dependent DNA helicase RecG